MRPDFSGRFFEDKFVLCTLDSSTQPFGARLCPVFSIIPRCLLSLEG